ncbi:hypothetical protein P7H62_15405 [Vagococcus carniphilus]|uniref:hypothetical protein n=1 Tax=Vagococcus carniphilus TaxID=218144 RepID=UPI00288D31D8|nr:hypothetical protein [Vagococcus carniphilus]MDT2832383.1 hypothetical protein [Vagococcus carniphilus]MDT2840730.1 hypothetical protein [Vagococcus carniphilus]MDT2855805.1 hypothetical protein [Vagococcus carniphilus]
MFKRLVKALERISNSLLIIEMILMEKNNLSYEDLSELTKSDEENKKYIENEMYKYSDRE